MPRWAWAGRHPTSVRRIKRQRLPPALWQRLQHRGCLWNKRLIMKSVLCSQCYILWLLTLCLYIVNNMFLRWIFSLMLYIDLLLHQSFLQILLCADKLIERASKSFKWSIPAAFTNIFTFYMSCLGRIFETIRSCTSKKACTINNLTPLSFIDVHKI